MTDIVVSLGTPDFSSPSTVLDLIERTKQHLHTGQRETRNKLSSAVNDTETTLHFTYELGRIGAGARVSIDLEDMYVWSASGTTAVVERGQFASVLDSHLSGAMVLVDTRYTPNEIFREIQNVMTALSGLGIYQMLTVDLTFNPSLNGYDLSGVGTEMLDIYDIYYDTGVIGEWRKVENYTHAPAMPTVSFPSSHALFIYDGGSSNLPIRVQYKAKLTPITALTDNVTDLGLPASAVDLLPLGAAMNLTAGTEIRRNDIASQTDTRRPSEVPPGAALRSNLGLAQQFQTRVREEVNNLYALYPALQPQRWNI